MQACRPRGNIVPTPKTPMKHRNGLRLRVVVVLIVLAIAAQTLPSETANRVDEIVTKAITEQQIPAISVAIALNGQIQYQKAYGKADLENNVPASPETLFSRSALP